MIRNQEETAARLAAVAGTATAALPRYGLQYRSHNLPVLNTSLCQTPAPRRPHPRRAKTTQGQLKIAGGCAVSGGRPLLRRFDYSRHKYTSDVPAKFNFKAVGSMSIGEISVTRTVKVDGMTFFFFEGPAYL